MKAFYGERSAASRTIFAALLALLLLPVSAPALTLKTELVSAERKGDTVTLAWRIVDLDTDADPDTAGVQPAVLFERTVTYGRLTVDGVQETLTAMRARILAQEKAVRDEQLARLAAVATDEKAALAGIEQ